MSSASLATAWIDRRWTPLPVLQVTLSRRVNPAIQHSLVTHAKLRASLLPMKGAKSNDWSLSAEGPLLRVGQGHFWLVQKHARSSLFSQRLHLLHSTGFLIPRPGFLQESRAFFTSSRAGTQYPGPRYDPWKIPCDGFIDFSAVGSA